MCEIQIEKNANRACLPFMIFRSELKSKKRNAISVKSKGMVVVKHRKLSDCKFRNSNSLEQFGRGSSAIAKVNLKKKKLTLDCS